MAIPGAEGTELMEALFPHSYAPPIVPFSANLSRAYKTWLTHRPRLHLPEPFQGLLRNGWTEVDLAEQPTIETFQRLRFEDVRLIFPPS
jgi:hypothetical protein